MGQKLSPPILASTIPAFYSNSEGIVITIPYSMNRAVSKADVSAFAVKIKTMQSGDILYQSQNVSKNDDTIKIEIPKKINKIIEGKTTLKDNEDFKKFKIGQFYKIQIAYVNNETVGYYSTVAVGKYTAKPVLTIENLKVENLNSHLYEYCGIYKQEEDITERVYTYCFTLYDNAGNIIASSGDLLHNTDLDDKDDPNRTIDKYTFTQDLLVGQSYKVRYSVSTVNNLTISSPAYRITQKRSITSDLEADLKVKLNYDNGYVNIDLKSTIPETEISKLASGSFIVARACEDTDYTVWDEVYRFTLTAQIPTLHLCKDFTVEQGKYYRYGIQQYNSNGLRSNRILSDIIYVDFEDAFLFDGIRQLKIKYNPKVSSFKKNLLETKTDTIGGKHPFIFRNGRVYYSEFPISGLISYQMDEENLFLSEKEYGLTEKTTNIVGENFAAERMFKMKALEWLTNGEPKIFRSPSEGNFIVRLMNSSLSPNDTVGRMLHTFSSTAYEIADFNYSTLGDLGFIKIADQTMTSLQWETMNFMYKDENNRYQTVATNTNLISNKVKTVRFNDMTPGEVVKIHFVGAAAEALEEIKIGVTGSYYIDTGVLIDKIILNQPSGGSMTFGYEYTKQPRFETVHSVDVSERPGHQFVGEVDILEKILYVRKDDGTLIKNPKLEIVEIYNVAVEKRPLQRVTDPNKDEPLDLTNLSKDPYLIYEYGNYLADHPGFRPGYLNSTFELISYYDAYNNIEYKESDCYYEPYIVFNGETVSVNEIEETNFQRPGKITELKSGNGCLVTLSYQLCDITYNVEVEAKKVISASNFLYDLGNAIKKYENALSNLKELLNEASQINKDNNDDDLLDKIDSARASVNSTYAQYIVELDKALEEDSRRRGEIE